MTRALIDRQSELPRSIPLFRYAPDRVCFSWRDWDPALVRSADDVPQYLVLGDMDTSTFERSAAGWSARWQGTEDDTHFDVAYKAETQRWEIRQTWCGLDGGFSVYPAHMPLDKVICQALCTQFPRNWDREAKAQLESAYQITVVEQPENAYSFCGIPDGAFRTIVFPIAVGNLRPVRQWIYDWRATAHNTDIQSWAFNVLKSQRQELPSLRAARLRLALLSQSERLQAHAFDQVAAKPKHLLELDAATAQVFLEFSSARQFAAVYPVARQSGWQARQSGWQIL